MGCIFNTKKTAPPIKGAVGNERYLQAVMNTVLDGLIIIDAKGIVQSFNPSAERIFGYRSDEVIDQNVKMLMPDPYHKEHDEYLHHYLTTGDKKVIGIGREVSGKRKDGSEFPMELGVNEMELGGARMFVGTIRDITERKAAERETQQFVAALKQSTKELEESGLRLKFAMETTGIGTWELNLENNSAYRSLSHDVIFGYRQLLPKWDYKLFLEHVVPEDRPEVDSKFKHATKTKSDWDFECLINRADGEKRWIWAKGRYHFDHTGIVPMMSGIVMDITQHKEIEQQLKNSILHDKRTLEILQESVDQFQLLANSLPQLVWTANETGWIYWYNDRWYEYTGTTLKDMEGWGWQSVHDPKQLPSVMEKWEKSIATGEPFEMVFPLKGSDGIFRPFLTRVIPVKDIADKVTKWLGTNTDITVQKRAEDKAIEALRISEERYDLTVRGMSIGVWDWNIVTNELYWSRRFLDMIGVTLTDLDFKPHYDEFVSRLHPDDKERTEKMIYDHLKHLCPYNLEYRLKHNNGQYIWIHAQGQAQWNANDEPIRMAGSVTDITEHKEAEKQKALLAAIVESSEDAIISKTLKGIIVSWNKAAEALLGYAAADAIGKPINLIIPQDRQDEELLILEEMKRGSPIKHLETVRMHKDGHSIDVALTISPMRDNQGNVIGISKIIHDMSERKKADKQREVLIKKLADSNTELEEFAYIASHDLKAPLRVIDNASLWLEEDLAEHLTDDTRENMNLLRGRVHRMEKLLDDLLEYSRVGRIQDDRFAEIIAGNELMSDILALLSPPQGFRVNVGSNFANIQVKRMPLQQVLMHLIGNAIKHHDKSVGIIDVTVKDSDSFYIFAVKDDGPGISAQFHEQIFKIFQTLRPRDQVEGSGMGLALVRKNMAIFGGTMKLESSQGKGSVFSFTWPKIHKKAKKEDIHDPL